MTLNLMERHATNVLENVLGRADVGFNSNIRVRLLPVQVKEQAEVVVLHLAHTFDLRPYLSSLVGLRLASKRTIKQQPRVAMQMEQQVRLRPYEQPLKVG